MRLERAPARGAGSTIEPGADEQVERAYNPRVIVKFRDHVEIPYRGDVQREVERLGAGWEAVALAFPGVRLRPLFTALGPEEIEALVARAQKLDREYRPTKLTAYFAIDCPPRVDAKALAATLSSSEMVETAYVESGPAPPPQAVNPSDDPRYKNQGYLTPAPDGVDAAYAWQLTGGSGKGVKLVDVECGWMLGHEDLSSAAIQKIYGVNKSLTGMEYVEHGTAVLGIVLGADNTKGGIGIAPDATAQVASEWETTSKLNLADALLKAIASLGFGDVLLLELQTDVYLPIETEPAVVDLLRLATALGIVVVEAAGNGGKRLDLYKSPANKLVLDPTSSDFEDSGAILVGASKSATPHYRWANSNLGARVDCYAWGESVDTCWSDANGTTSDYTTSFGGTSSASAIVAGVALLVQSMAAAKLNYRLSGWQMRKLLGDATLGTAAELPPEQTVGDPGIGVMPDLKAILSKGLGLAPDVYLRDYVGDTGDPHQGAINASPDVILRHSKEADPKAAFGEGSGQEDSNTLGAKAKPKQDNYVYVRLRNRGGTDAKDVSVSVYWAPVATLITPFNWTLVGSVKIPLVPSGDTLTVSDAITWKAASIPPAGHYCFVAIAGSDTDPAPLVPDFLDWTKFQRIIRENNNVTWRNFQVESNAPKPPSSFLELPFLAPGAPQLACKMSLLAVMRLPEGSEAWLEMPDSLMDALGASSPAAKPKPGQNVTWIPLNPHGRTTFREAVFPAGSAAELKLLVRIPERFRERAHEVHVSQLFEDREVGRVTWRLVPQRA